MLKVLDWGFIALMGFGVAGHLIGTFKFYELNSGIFVWSLAGVLAATLVTALNILRRMRSRDKAIAVIALAASLGWFAIAVLFGFSVGTFVDPRVLIHAIAAAGLSFFCLRAVMFSPPDISVAL